jgi:hypothetical protein
VTIPLFDANACIGRRLAPWPNEPATAAALLREMKCLDIDRALVGHYSCWESDISIGNRLSKKELAGHPAFTATSVVVPDTGGDTLPVKTVIRNLVRDGMRAVRLFPRLMNWSPARWCAGTMFRELEKQRLPALWSWSETTPQELHATLVGYPRLPILVYNLNYRLNRILVPLLKQHRNLHVIISPPYAAHQGLEILSGQGLVKQLLFGTGYPTADPAATITYLMYAKIPEKEKRLIGSGNLEKLVNGVRS